MVDCERHDDVAVVFMNDGKANALNAGFLEKLSSVLQQACSSQAVVLTGHGGFFSGGLDLKVLPGLSPADFKTTVDAFESLIRWLLQCPVPTVAAVNGHALAGGAVLTLACDLALAAAGPHKIGLNETAIGIPLPEFVMQLARLKLQPRSWLKALVAGQVGSPDEAARIGFVDDVVPPEMLLARAKEMAHQLAKVPGPAYQSTRALLYRELLALPPGQLSQGISQAFLQGKVSHNLGKR